MQQIDIQYDNIRRNDIQHNEIHYYSVLQLSLGLYFKTFLRVFVIVSHLETSGG